MATHKQSPSYGAKQMLASTPVTFQFAEVGSNEIAAAAGRRADESPWWKIPANVWLDGSWQERAWFPSPLLYTALTRLQQLVGRKFKVDERVEVEMRGGGTAGGTSWLVTTPEIKQESGYPFMVDTDTDNLAAVVSEPAPAPAPAPVASPPPPSAPAADTPFVHKEPFVPPAPPPSSPDDVEPSYGTAINEHYKEQAWLSDERIRARNPNYPPSTASSIQASGATAQIRDERAGVDQVALVTVPGYPIAILVSSEPEPAPAEPKPKPAAPAMNVTDDDIPF